MEDWRKGCKMNSEERVSMSSKWELRSKREAQPGIEKLQDFQEGAERQEGQGHRGPEGLSTLTPLERQGKSQHRGPGGH